MYVCMYVCMKYVLVNTDDSYVETRQQCSIDRWVVVVCPYMLRCLCSGAWLCGKQYQRGWCKVLWVHRTVGG